MQTTTQLPAASAHHPQLVLLPALQPALDDDLSNGAGGEPAGHDGVELFTRMCETAVCPA